VNLWVVLPAYDEERRLPQTLAALAAQDDTDLTLVVVDNGSTDGTAAVAKAFDAPFPVHVLTEFEKGVGSAVDTGFRFAIDDGATHLARTDADCLPHPDWVREVRAGFASGAELVCGHIVARRDENGPLARAAFRAMVVSAALFGRYRAKNRGPDYLIPYAMHAGNNMAITADLYERCGGVPRMPSPTDRTFLNRVRRHTTRVAQRRTMVSENSMRRIQAYGVLGSARWYLDRGPGEHTPDPR
jgi:glycosyltransferase involved in cell wall biosynthesis